MEPVLSPVSAGDCVSLLIARSVRERRGARYWNVTFLMVIVQPSPGRAAGRRCTMFTSSVLYLPIFAFLICESGGYVLYMNHTSLLYPYPKLIREDKMCE